MLSEKYGYRPLLPSIDAQEFELILSTTTDEQTRELLTKYGVAIFIYLFIYFTPFVKQIYINRDNKVGKFKQLRCYFQKEYGMEKGTL